MPLFSATVVSNAEIMPSTHVLTLECGDVARNATPGQFLHIRCSASTAPLLRRPMSIYRAADNVIELMIRGVGEGSRWLIGAVPGQRLDCLGPQGRGFRLDSGARQILMVGGGYGVAPLVGLAERATGRGLSVALAVGASTAELVFPSRLLPPEVEYAVATIDGTAGYRGLVTDLVSSRLPWADAVYSCGPLPMMAALARLLRIEGWRKPGFVAMEERMGCSMGVCLGCVVETRRGPLRVCTEGPVFRIADVVWRDESAALIGTGANH